MGLPPWPIVTDRNVRMAVGAQVAEKLTPSADHTLILSLGTTVETPLAIDPLQSAGWSWPISDTTFASLLSEGAPIVNLVV